MKKEGGEEDFFVSDKLEEDDEVMPVSESPFLVKYRVCGVKFLDLPCLASGYNLNLTSKDMADLRRQGIAVDGNNGPANKNITVPVNIPLPQL